MKSLGAVIFGLGILAALGCGSSSKSTVGTIATGSGLKCDSSSKNAWDTYGQTAFVAVNESIFSNVNSEIATHGTTNLGDSLTKIGSGTPPATADSLATFKGSLAAFLVYIYGGPPSITYTDGKLYTGPQQLVPEHTGLNITSSQYDYFVANIIVPALTKNGVKHGAGGVADPNDVTSCFAPVVTDATFKGAIVGH